MIGRVRSGLALVVVCGCSFTPGQVGVRDDASIIDDVAVDDAPVDTPVPLPAWGNVTMLVAGPGVDDPTLTDDRLELYFNRTSDIYVATRASVNDAFGNATLDVPLSTGSIETTPEVSGDGLTMIVASNRSGGGACGDQDLWISTRATRSEPWPTPTHIDALCSAQSDTGATVSPDGRRLVMSSHRTGTMGLADLYIATRASTSDAWSTPVVLTELNTSASDADPVLSPDGLTIYFFSTRTVDADLYVATRTSTSVPFSTPVSIDELNTAGSESDPWVSTDQRVIVFERDGALVEASR